MTTKYSRIVIKTNPENWIGLQKLLFKYEIGWGFQGKKLVQNYEEYLQIRKIRGRMDSPNVIYSGAGNDNDFTTLRVDGNDLNKITDWLESEFLAEPEIKAGQKYHICGMVDPMTLVVESGGLYRIMDKYYTFCSMRYTGQDVVEQIKNGNWKLIS